MQVFSTGKGLEMYQNLRRNSFGRIDEIRAAAYNVIVVT